MTDQPSLLERAQRFLFRRRHAYRQVFTPDNVFTDEVLRDLAKFCRAHESTFATDHSLSDRLDGRREVWLRIQHHLKLTEEDLWRIYGQK